MCLSRLISVGQVVVKTYLAAKRFAMPSIKMPVALLLAAAFFGKPCFVKAQPLLETGPDMPAEWIDKDTHHKVVRLGNLPGSNSAFYFHNNPFYNDHMVFYNTGVNGKQLYLLNLKTNKAEQLTNRATPMSGEMVCPKTGEAFYQVMDSVFAMNLATKKERLVFVFPEDFKATISTVNADATMLGGALGNAQEKEIFKQYPEKSQYFNRVYEAKLPRTLFAVDLKKGQVKKLLIDSAWLNHVQFSPVDPNLLMFCHEGPWHKVTRIWTINIANGEIKKMHTRTMDMEIWGHEWFSPDGKTIWFDWQRPRSVNFAVAGVDVATGVEKSYTLQRNEWSIHFNISPDQKLFCGDGGDSGQVAKAPDGMWIYLFRPDGDHFNAEKLVNMKRHNYRLEPNVHFSPDGKWVIFRANFEGEQQVYAVKVAAEN